MGKEIGFNKYLPFAVVYFFFNGVLLPFGMLFTTLLTPFFIFWLLNTRLYKYIWYFFPFLLPYLIIHLYNGIDPFTYIKSSLLLFSVYVFGLALVNFLDKCSTLRTIYKKVLLLNALLVVIAIVALFIPKLSEILWYNNLITPGFNRMKRLQLFTYEPSYYSTLLAPIALYYYLKIMAEKIDNAKLIFFLVTIPLVLSFSFGVLSAILIALLIAALPRLRLFFPRLGNPVVIVFLFILGCLALLIVGQIYPENIIFVRLQNIFSGNDTSFRGRTYDSFYLGWEIAREKSIWFGCGPGQPKLVGIDIYRTYYNHNTFTVDEVKIPNSLGDTLAAFGLVGLILRLATEIILFLKTKVYSSYYRMALFVYIFVYQFTGSFITNIAEYAIWILAFYPGLFPELDKDEINQYLRERRSKVPDN